MLLNLQIRDFAIVDNLEIDFSPGMSALTGETGAGKSILLMLWVCCWATGLMPPVSVMDRHALKSVPSSM